MKRPKTENAPKKAASFWPAWKRLANIPLCIVQKNAPLPALREKGGLFSVSFIGLTGAIGAVVGSVIGCYYGIKKAKWWLPQVFILIFVAYCLLYGFLARPHPRFGPEGMLPIFGLAVVGSFILSLGWLVSWVWLLRHNCRKKAIVSFWLWLLVGGLQMLVFIAALIFGNFKYYFWLPFPPI